MHIVVDDTYGPTVRGPSKYVTGNRRTYVGVMFDDNAVQSIRDELKGCLKYMSNYVERNIEEFHFVDIYNRNGIWKNLPEHVNLTLIEAFAHIYGKYRWRVIVQTVDNRTVKDFERLARKHNQMPINKVKMDDFKLHDHGDLALFLLCIRIRSDYISLGEPLTLILDDGRKKPGQLFGNRIFREKVCKYHGYYESSKVEPLLQIADLVAFCINRCTYLATKPNRTEIDYWFMRVVTEMRIRSDDLTPLLLPQNFTVEDFDRSHHIDRQLKGLQD